MSGSGRPKRVPLKRLIADGHPDTDPERIHAAIVCGEIRVNGHLLRDPNAPVAPDAEVSWTVRRFVGRGGHKLDGALDLLGIDPAGQVCLDAGASTGGFTDCLLSRGAVHVHTVDVGYNQLAWKLRTDVRVTVRERTNLMDLERNDLDPPPDLAVADLSFRSLRGAASRLLELTGGGIVIVLVKPQFEGPREPGFDGVVRTREARSAVLTSLFSDLRSEGAAIWDIVASPLRGRKGNAEFFLLLSNRPPPDPLRVSGRVESALDEADAAQKSSRPSGPPTQKPSPPR